MQKFILLIVFLISFLDARSQDMGPAPVEPGKYNLMLKGGLTLNQYVQGTENYEGGQAYTYTYSVGYNKRFSPGIVLSAYLLRLTERGLSFRPEIRYMLISQPIHYSIYSFQGFTTSTEKADYMNYASYLSLPLLVNYTFGKKVKLHLYAGPDINLHLASFPNGTWERKEQTYNPADNTQQHKVLNNFSYKESRKDSRVFISAEAGLDLEFNMAGKRMLAGFSSGYALTNTLSSPNLKNRCLTFSFSIPVGRLR